MKTSFLIGRRGLERLDLLLLVVEALDLNAGEYMVWGLKKLGLESLIPNRVELWKRRCYNPLRRTTRRGQLNAHDGEALMRMLCSMADRIYPLLHQLLSSKEPDLINRQRWSMLEQRLQELVEERMNPRRGAVQRLLIPKTSHRLYRELVLTLALASGPGGIDRLRACLLDPTP